MRNDVRILLDALVNAVHRQLTVGCSAAANCVHVITVISATPTRPDHGNDEQCDEQEATHRPHYDRQEWLEVFHGGRQWHVVRLLLGILQRGD